MRQKDGVGRTEACDEAGQYLVNGRLFSDHFVGDAVHLLDLPGNGDVRINERLEGGQLAAVEAKAYGPDFDEAVHHGWRPVVSVSRATNMMSVRCDWA